MKKKSNFFSKDNLLEIFDKNTDLEIIEDSIFGKVMKSDARTAYRFCLATNSYYVVDRYGLRLFGRIRSFNHRNNSLNQGLFITKTNGDKIIEHNLVHDLNEQYPFIYKGDKKIVFIESRNISEKLEETYKTLLKNKLNPEEYILNLVDTKGSQWEHYFEFLASEMFIKKGYLTDIQIPWSYHGTPDFAAYHHKIIGLLKKKGFINYGALIIELSSLRFFSKKRNLHSNIHEEEKYSLIIGEVKSKQNKSQILEYLETGLPFKGYEFIPNKENREKYSGLIKIDNSNMLKIEEAPKNPFYNAKLSEEDLKWFEKYLKIILFGNLTKDELSSFLERKLKKDKKLTFINLIKLADNIKFEEILNIL